MAMRVAAPEAKLTCIITMGRAAMQRRGPLLVGSAHRVALMRPNPKRGSSAMFTERFLRHKRGATLSTAANNPLYFAVGAGALVVVIGLFLLRTRK